MNASAEFNGECWPDNWLPLMVLAGMRTQWNIIPGRVVGLKYESITTVLDELAVAKKMRAEVIAALRIMELEALEIFNRV